MFRFIAVAVAVKAATVLTLMGSVYVFPDIDPDKVPDLSTPAAIAAVAAAVFWFARTVKRPMLKGEIFSFAGGVTIGEIAISVGIFFLMILEAGQPFSLEGLNAAMSDGGTPIEASAFALSLVFGVILGALMTFIIAAFFAWILTKNLPVVVDDFD